MTEVAVELLVASLTPHSVQILSTSSVLIDSVPGSFVLINARDLTKVEINQEVRDPGSRFTIKDMLGVGNRTMSVALAK